MIVNAENIKLFSTGLKTAFMNGLGIGPMLNWDKIGQTIPSDAREEHYGNLMAMGGIREWIGDRHYQQLKGYDYVLKNKDYEQTVTVPRNDIEDNVLATHSKVAELIGSNVRQFPEEQIFQGVKAGDSTVCYDGQNFFDTDHVVFDEAGNEVLVSNSLGGGGTPWFLFDASRPLKPVIYQERKSFEMVERFNPEDPHVFDRKEFVYGVDGRSVVGFGFWQMALRSEATLDAAAWDAARKAMTETPKDGGGFLGIRPTHIVVPPVLEGAAKRLFAAERTDAGNSNTNFQAVEIVVTPFIL